MQQDREHKDIEEFFCEVMPEIERGAPDFDRDWDAAVARQGARPRARLGSGVLALVLLIALGVTALLAVGPRAKPPVEQSTSVAPVPPRVPDPEPLQSVGPAPSAPPRVAKHASRRRPGQSAASIAEWHSPTDSLLAWSGTTLLTKVPRLDESIVDTRAFPVVDAEEPR